MSGLLGATITIEKTGEEFHTLRDLKLVITSPASIAEPVIKTNYIKVPGSNTMLDVTEALTGRPTFEKRPIKIQMAGIDNSMSWDSIISNLRNTFEGRVVHVTFDNDTTHYWRGRAHLLNYDRAKMVGYITFALPDADPYKYNVSSNVEPWLWDLFDFENDIVPTEPIIEIDGTETIVVPAGKMPTCPEFTVSEVQRTITLTTGGKTYTMKNGYNYFPALMINGDNAVTLTFNGKGKVLMVYRGGSL